MHRSVGPTSTRSALVLGGFLAGVGATLVGLFAFGLLDDGSTPPAAIERVQDLPTPTDAAAIAEPTLDALVGLDIGSEQGERHGGGVIFRDDGHLLTSADLVAGATSIDARLMDGRRLPATVAGVDTVTDLAVLRIEGERFPTVTLGSARDLESGERVIAIGSAPSAAAVPLVAEGVIRAVGLRLDTSDGPLFDLVLASEPAGDLPGGAALLDQQGAVVAIVTGRTGTPAPDPGVAGAYATPMEYAGDVARQLADKGEVAHPWLGLEATDAGGGGAQIDGVAAAGPAEASGLRPGDVITAVDGRPVTSYTALMTVVRARDTGDTVHLTYRRAGSEATCSLTLVTQPARRETIP